MAKISRSRIARQVVDQLESGRSVKQVVLELAAYLVNEKRQKELDMIIRDIYDEYESRGVVLAEVTSARQLDQSVRQQIEQLVGGDRIELIEKVDPSVISGFKLSTPSRHMDATIRSRLAKLRESK